MLDLQQEPRGPRFNGRKLWEMRRRAGIHQTELARTVGVTVTTISSWEVNRTQPKLDNAVLLCQALGCTIDDLLEHDEPARAATPDRL